LSTRIAEFSNDLNESKRPISKIGQKALVQVQNKYSRREVQSESLPDLPSNPGHGQRGST